MKNNFSSSTLFFGAFTSVLCILLIIFLPRLLFYYIKLDLIPIIDLGVKVVKPLDNASNYGYFIYYDKNNIIKIVCATGREINGKYNVKNIKKVIQKEGLIEKKYLIICVGDQNKKLSLYSENVDRNKDFEKEIIKVLSSP